MFVLGGSGMARGATLVAGGMSRAGAGKVSNGRTITAMLPPFRGLLLLGMVGTLDMFLSFSGLEVELRIGCMALLGLGRGMQGSGVLHDGLSFDEVLPMLFTEGNTMLGTLYVGPLRNRTFLLLVVRRLVVLVFLRVVGLAPFLVVAGIGMPLTISAVVLVVLVVMVLFSVMVPHLVVRCLVFGLTFRIVLCLFALGSFVLLLVLLYRTLCLRVLRLPTTCF